MIGGWLAGRGQARRPRSARSPSACTTDGALRYAGKVGTGFTEATLRDARCASSSRCAAGESPFDGRQPPKGTIFVEPRLVAEVEFREWTRTGTLRAPSFKGLRPDVDPRTSCARER